MKASPTASLPAGYFDALYARDPDPWGFEVSAYEDAKYRATLEALPRLFYPRALEIGCSIGVLTAQLAPRCGALTAIDTAHSALERARRRCAAFEHVTFSLGHVPGDWPEGSYDLILLSEVVYYLERRDVRRLAGHIRRSLAPGGHVLLVHWIGETDYPLSGDAAAECLIGCLGTATRVTRQDRTSAYRLDLMQKDGAHRRGSHRQS